MHPFANPAVIPWDVVRLYTSLAAVVVLVGMAVQLFHPQPGIRRELQVARGLFILGTGAVLLGLISGSLVRLGNPPNAPVALIAFAAGVSILLGWLVAEHRARKAAP